MPDEVKLLPCEPTPEMLEAGVEAACLYDGEDYVTDVVRAIYGAMWNTRAIEATRPTDEVVERGETGWLIEEDARGITHWIALAKDAWPRTTASTHPFASNRYMHPVERVKDANEALRFARKQDAEAFIKLFDRFLLDPVATEHEWPARAALHQEGITTDVGRDPATHEPSPVSRSRPQRVSVRRKGENSERD